MLLDVEGYTTGISCQWPGYVGGRLGCAEGPGYICRYQGEGPGCFGEGLGYVRE